MIFTNREVKIINSRSEISMCSVSTERSEGCEERNIHDEKIKPDRVRIFERMSDK